jgi:STAS-like domain of unknown function (DUF4325)
MSYSYALADHGKTLATRPFGKELRVDLVQKAAGQDIVSLDFSGVLSTSHSFADEFVARLAEEVELGEVGFAVTISGASTNVERVVRRALDRRSVDLPLLV